MIKMYLFYAVILNFLVFKSLFLKILLIVQRSRKHDSIFFKFNFLDLLTLHFLAGFQINIKPHSL